MAKLSLEKIADINRRDLGVNGRFYEDVEGYIYIGKGTRLFKYAKCSEVSLDVDSVPGASNVCEALNILNTKLNVVSVVVEGAIDNSFASQWAANTLMNC